MKADHQAKKTNRARRDGNKPAANRGFRAIRVFRFLSCAAVFAGTILGADGWVTFRPSTRRPRQRFDTIRTSPLQTISAHTTRDVLISTGVRDNPKTDFCSDVVGFVESLSHSNVTFRHVSVTEIVAQEQVLPIGTANMLLLETRSYSLVLRLVPSPICEQEIEMPWVSNILTDAIEKNSSKSIAQGIVHLHEDSWWTKNKIVKARICQRLGILSGRRIFARKTVVRRIDAPTAHGFLQEHHLWGAVKCRYYYGMFYRHSDLMNGDEEMMSEEECLVAVASFSSRRKVLRNGIPFKSHELVRFCTKTSIMVVGGISKLLAAFHRDVRPDDVVTSIDRDWGGGHNWHSAGFATVSTMPPLIMCIRASDGQRRHLVGAGIKIPEKDEDLTIDQATTGRFGIPIYLLEELSQLSPLDSSSAMVSLIRCGYYPVYDTGVERLAKFWYNAGDCDPVSLWMNSIPKFAETYYSGNPGVQALLKETVRTA